MQYDSRADSSGYYQNWDHSSQFMNNDFRKRNDQFVCINEQIDEDSHHESDSRNQERKSNRDNDNQYDMGDHISNKEEMLKSDHKYNNRSQGYFGESILLSRMNNTENNFSKYPKISDIEIINLE